MWEDVHEAVDRVLLAEAIQTVLSKLSFQEHVVIHCRFWEEMNFSKTGKVIKRTGGRAAQIYEKALRRLRHPCMATEFSKIGLDLKASYIYLKLQRLEDEVSRNRSDSMRVINDQKWAEGREKRKAAALALLEARGKNDVWFNEWHLEMFGTYYGI